MKKKILVKQKKPVLLFFTKQLFSLFLSFFSICLLLFTLAPVVVAQQVDLSLTPPQIQILMKPGISLLQAFELQNNGDPAVFSIRIVSFEAIGDQGERVLKDKAEGPLRFSLENSGLALGDKFALNSKQSFQALLKIRSIQKAPAGDYYYTLLFSTEPPVTQKSAGRGRATIGVNILVSVTETGFTPIQGHIAQLQVIPRYRIKLFGRSFDLFETNDEIPVVLKVANTGNFLFVPRATLRLKGPFGVEATKKLLPVNVLRNSERLLTLDQPEKCSRCDRPVSAVFNGFYLGKYLVSAEVEFEGGNQKITAQNEFLAFPISLTLILILVLLGLIVVLIWLRVKKD